MKAPVSRRSQSRPFGPYLLIMRQSFVRRMGAARAFLLAMLGAATFLASACAASSTSAAGTDARNEIFYLIFVRSFRDSNGG